MKIHLDLDGWFSSERMATYATHPDPEAFYTWNTQLAAAYFEVIGHTEVLLRNAVSSALRPASNGDPWYLNPRYQFSPRDREQIQKARETLNSKGRRETTGGVIAELSFGFWRYLLSRRHRASVWVDLVPTLTHYPHGTDLARFAAPIEEVHKLRNRVAHLEPLVDANISREKQKLDGYDAALDTVSRWIDPDAAEWIAGVSRIATIRAQRP